MDFPETKWDKLFAIKKGEWLKEIKGQREFLKKLGKRLPRQLLRENSALKKRIKSQG